MLRCAPAGCRDGPVSRTCPRPAVRTGAVQSFNHRVRAGQLYRAKAGPRNEHHRTGV